jgi:RNA polymerase sigma-70 factor (ECF subfamily)
MEWTPRSLHVGNDVLLFFVHLPAAIRFLAGALQQMQATLYTDTTAAAAMTAQPDTLQWLNRFHAGDRAAMEECYRDYYQVVEAAVRGMLREADKETVIHEVFFALLSEPTTRQGFQGGSFAAWLRTLAKNRALDLLRRQQLERRAAPEAARQMQTSVPGPSEQRADARAFLSRFQKQCLPEKWRAVFETRFVQQLSQREAASTLGISRTTLAYQEHRIRALLKKQILQTKEGKP